MTTKVPQPSSSSDDKKQTDEKHYAILSKESIRMYGEGTSHVNLSDDIAMLMGEDVSYRLRQVIQVSSQFMRHCRRKKLTTADINKGLQSMDVQAVYGYDCSNSLPFVKAKEGLYHPADKFVSLADICASKVSVKHCPHTTVTATWATLDGVTQPPVPEATPPLPEVRLTYYTNITQAILSSDAELVKMSLNDLKTNNKISPLLPYFVSFVSNGVKSSSHDVPQMMKFLYTVKTVTSNRYVNLHPLPLLQVLVDTVLYCLLEPLAASINPLNDHWILRDYAANLLASITREWSCGMNNLESDIITKIHGTLQDLSKPFCSHYGAIVAFIALGHQCLEGILIPELSLYWNHLDLTLSDPSCANTPVMADALKVYGSLMLAVNLVLRRKIKRFTEQHAATAKNSQDASNAHVDQTATEGAVSRENVYEFYREMHEYFGDGLSIQLPEVYTKNVFTPIPSDVCIDLGDADTNKSGEELLEDFMRQVEEREKRSKVKEERRDTQVRLRQARLNFAAQKTSFVGKREIKREHDNDDLYSGNVKKSRLQEEWLDEVKQSGGLQRRGRGLGGDEDNSRSSEGSESLHSEDVSYPSVESEVSDPSEGIKITIKMLSSKSSPTVSQTSSPLAKGRKKSNIKAHKSSLDDEAKHKYQFDTKDFTKLKEIKTTMKKNEDYDILKLEQESAKRESLKLKLPVPGKVKAKSSTVTSPTKYS